MTIGASNNSSLQRAATLVEGSRRLLEAEQAAEVGHHVCVSIVGCEQVPMGCRPALDAPTGAQVRRERYAGPWLPEPLVEPTSAQDPADQAERPGPRQPVRTVQAPHRADRASQGWVSRSGKFARQPGSAKVLKRAPVMAATRTWLSW
jgi:hypothetical protein